MIDATIREVLAAQGNLAGDPATIADDADLYAAGLTSHASVNVMLALEDAFDVEFPEQMMRKATFASVAVIRAAMEELLSSTVSR
jgi:acyl carrier protein